MLCRSDICWPWYILPPGGKRKGGFINSKNILFFRSHIRGKVCLIMCHNKLYLSVFFTLSYMLTQLGKAINL